MIYHHFFMRIGVLIINDISCSRLSLDHKQAFALGYPQLYGITPQK